MTVFETARLRAREWTPDDAEAAFAIYRDADVVRFLGSVSTPQESVETQRLTLDRWITVTESLRPRGFGIWALETKDTGTVVGTSLLKPLPDVEEVEVGWHLGKEHWGRGYATEGARGAVEHGFTACGLDVVYAVVVPENVASVAVARRLGMTHEGRTDAYYGKTLELFSLRAGQGLDATKPPAP